MHLFSEAVVILPLVKKKKKKSLPKANDINVYRKAK